MAGGMTRVEAAIALKIVEDWKVIDDKESST